jgi:hypothetical protein
MRMKKEIGEMFGYGESIGWAVPYKKVNRLGDL